MGGTLLVESEVGRGSRLSSNCRCDWHGSRRLTA
jgi:hypothetical protein